MSDTFETSRVAIAARFKAGWVGPNAFAIRYEGVKFNQPNGKPWGELYIQQGKRNPIALGNIRNRTLGFVTLMIFIPQDQGSAPSTRAGDLLATIFDLAQITVRPGFYITFELVDVKYVRMRDGFSQYNAAVSFRVDNQP